MQTLFALQQLRSSDQQIALEHFIQSAELSLDDFKVSEEIQQTFKSSLNQQNTQASDVLPPEAQRLMQQSQDEYNNLIKKDLQYLRSQMLKEVEGIHRLFLWVMGLFPSLADHEQILLSKKMANTEAKPKSHFQNLLSIQAIQDSMDSLDVPSWNQYQGRLAQWYKEIKNHKGLEEEYPESDTLELEIKKLRYIFRSILWKSESFQNFFEEHDRGWVENKDIIKSLVSKTLKSIDDQGVELAPLSYQWEDDKQFFTEIFDTTVENESWTEKLVAEHADNWEMDRIAQVDMILLKMAVTEMINFPSIPVKVTINEYIELSKKYSTPKSKKFINGILDVLANHLTNNGTIKKSGRGLIDNK